MSRIKVIKQVNVFTCLGCESIYGCEIGKSFLRCKNCSQFYSRETDCVGIQLGLEKHEGYCSFCSKDLN